MRRSTIISCGSYLPEKILTNQDLAKIVDTSDEWILQRTGIRQRHMAAKGQTTSDMATRAAWRALEKAGMTGRDIDAIFLATTTPDQTFPATSVTVQDRIGMGDRGFAMDLQAVCSGFIYALATADNFIKAGQIKRALVIGAEHFTNLLDWNDRTTCVLFGDGAGAVVLVAQESEGRVSDRGVLTSHLRSDGRHREKLFVDGGPSTTGTVGHLRMAGKEVFRHAVGMVTDVMRDAFAATGTSADDLDWFVPHQANERIIDASAEKLGIAGSKIVKTVQMHGNTSAASIPLALSVASADGRIKRGDLVMLEAMGGGFTWGSVLVRW
jgi:3-oxoacyl-[acyl-carrier-protein] synthase-3